MKVLVLFCSLMVCSVYFAQTNLADLEKIEGIWIKKGSAIPFTGQFIEYYDNGKVKGKGVFKAGVVDSLRTTYYENGNKKRDVNYSNGILNGFDKQYHENGNVKQEGIFKNGKLEGQSKVYYESGVVQAILNFSNGIQAGDYFEYSKESKLIVQYFFVDGQASYSSEFKELTKQALAFSRDGKNKEAIKLYDKAIELNPTVARAYFNRGACKSNAFAFEEAIKDFDKAIEIDPKYMEAYGNRGNARINIHTSKGNRI